MFAFWDNWIFWIVLGLYFSECIIEGYNKGYAQEGIKQSVRASLRESALRREQAISQTHSPQGFPAIEDLVQRGSD